MMNITRVENPDTSSGRISPAGSGHPSPDSRIGIKAMVVDNDQRVLTISRDMLSQLGYSVCGYNTSADALFFASHSVFDLFLIELTMPEIDGYQLGRKIKFQYPFSRVIIMAELERSVLTEKINDPAIDGLLSKPFQMKDLMEVLMQVGLAVATILDCG